MFTAIRHAAVPVLPKNSTMAGTMMSFGDRAQREPRADACLPSLERRAISQHFAHYAGSAQSLGRATDAERVPTERAAQRRSAWPTQSDSSPSPAGCLGCGGRHSRDLSRSLRPLRPSDDPRLGSACCFSAQWCTCSFPAIPGSTAWAWRCTSPDGRRRPCARECTMNGGAAPRKSIG